MSDIETLKKKTLAALIRGLDSEEPQASMVAQAINYLKAFAGDEPPSSDPAKLSPMLAKFSGGNFQALTKQ